MMTFDNVFEQLHTVDRAVPPLLEASGFLNDRRLSEVRPLRDPAQDAFLRGIAESVLESLEGLHEDLAYLKSPVSGEYLLEPLPDGRYGFFDRNGNILSLSCGSTIEVKIRDHRERLRWAKCRVEHDGSDYYLWEHAGIPLAGLTVRVREVAL